MKHLGSTGIAVSALGLGCNNFGARLDFESTREIVAAALDAGVTFFDTADAYGDGESERFLGRILEGQDDVVLATKFGWGTGPGDGVAHGAPDAIRAAVNASLERLRSDYIDVYYYHRPDGVTPIPETIAAMQELVNEGLVRAVACSNVSREEVAQAHESSGCAIAAVQNEYNLLRRTSSDVLEYCQEHELGFVPYRPLAQGLLTGKYRRNQPLPERARLQSRPEAIAAGDFDRLERLEAYARERGRTLLELAVAWLSSQPGVSSVIAGAMSPEQLRENIAASNWTLSEDDLAEVAQIA